MGEELIGRGLSSKLTSVSLLWRGSVAETSRSSLILPGSTFKPAAADPAQRGTQPRSIHNASSSFLISFTRAFASFSVMRGTCRRAR
jgi:hypothetical protein